MSGSPALASVDGVLPIRLLLAPRGLLDSSQCCSFWSCVPFGCLTDAYAMKPTSGGVVDYLDGIKVLHPDPKSVFPPAWGLLLLTGGSHRAIGFYFFVGIRSLTLAL